MLDLRLVTKILCVMTLAASATWLAGCCCCGSGVPPPGGEYIVSAPGRSTLPDLKELRAATPSAATTTIAY